MSVHTMRRHLALFVTALAFVACTNTCGKHGGAAVVTIAGAGRIACGGAECATPSQVCCNEGGQLQCVDADPSKVAATPPNPYLVFGACEPRKPDGGPFAAAMCDDSTDCAAGALCCPPRLPDRYLGCMTAAKDCYGLESCREGTCRTPGTSCVGGECRPATTGAIACGALTCTGKTPVCCFQQAMKLVTDAGVQEAPPLAACVSRDEKCPTLPFVSRFECDDAADCGSMRCCASATSRGSTCAPNCLGGITCRSDEDCKDPDVELFHGESLGGHTFTCRGGGPLLPRDLRTCELF